MNGTAQQNLTSLININAVNSNVSVLLNLNVNINSSVGTLTQTNLTGKTLMSLKKQLLSVGLVIGLASPLLSPAPASAQKTGEATGVPGEQKYPEHKRDTWPRAWCGSAGTSVAALLPSARY